jgi:hypothetical protein
LLWVHVFPIGVLIRYGAVHLNRGVRVDRGARAKMHATVCRD